MLHVDPAKIKKMLESLTFEWTIPGDSSAVICFAKLPMMVNNQFVKRVVGTGMSACLDPRKFNSQFGIELSKKRAIEDAEKRLFELEGYHVQLNHMEKDLVGDTLQANSLLLCLLSRSGLVTNTYKTPNGTNDDVEKDMFYAGMTLSSGPILISLPRYFYGMYYGNELDVLPSDAPPLSQNYIDKLTNALLSMLNHAVIH